MSSGLFRVDQILNMEKYIIRTLQWFLNPPTASMFLNVALPLIDAATGDPQASFEVAELSRYLVELSMCDEYFVDKKPSSIAYASILVAMDYLSTHVKVKRKFCSHQIYKSAHVTKLCAKRLHHVYGSLVEDDLSASSPTCVITDLHQ